MLSTEIRPGASPGAAGPLTDRLADYIASAGERALPPDVVAQAKLCVLDALGCIVGGSALRPAQIAAELAGELGGRPEATVVGQIDRLPAPWAAFANAAAANALDMDDTQEGHPSACIVPAALACAERVGAPGSRLLAAIVAGYDVCERVGGAIKPTPERYRQVYGFGTFQIISAAATAAVVFGLDHERVLHTLGLAGVAAPVPSHRKAVSIDERPISWVKNHYGWVTMGGIVAAQMAEKGFFASQSILDGDSGFWIMAGSDRFDPDRLTDRLGERFSILETGFKPYPSCRYIQSSVGAVLDIQRDARLQPSEIESIHVRSFGRLQEFMDPSPTGFMEGMFSLPYCLAVAALGYPPGSAWLSPATRANTDVQRIARTVTLEVDPDADRAFFGDRKYPTTVTITARGREWTTYRCATKGDPEDPLTEADLRAKYHDLADPTLGRATADDIESLVDRLDSLPELSRLGDLLAQRNAGQRPTENGR